MPEHLPLVSRIYPNAEQRRAIDETIDAGRWSYNQALAERKAAYEATGKSPSTADMVKRIPAWKREHPWLAGADSMALQQAVRDNGRAYDNFFRKLKSGKGRPGYPRFKSKRDRVQSYRTNNSASGKAIAVLDSRHVKLPKLGAVKARVTRDVPGRITSATVKRTATGKYLCVLLFEVPDGAVGRWPMPEGAPEVTGIDMGALRRARVRKPQCADKIGEEARPRAAQAVAQEEWIKEPRAPASQGRPRP